MTGGAPARKAAQEVLAGARRLIEQGWAQRRMSVVKDGRPCYCALGAIEAASYSLGRTAEGDASRALAAVTILGTAIFSISRWNDDPRRTQAQVVEAFKLAEASL